MTDSVQSGQLGDVTPPPPFRRISSDSFQLKRGGGMFAIFGMPFFLAGVCMLLGVAGIIPVYAESGARSNPGILGPMSFVFLAVGGIMVFGRQWLIVDLGRGSILRQIGLLVPLRTEERPLSEFNAVLLSHDPGNSESAETYPVRLRASIGKDVAIITPLQFGESVRLAEYLAKVLRLQLIDSTTDHETTVNPDRVGASLRDRISRAPVSASPQKPAPMRSQVVDSAGKTKIVIPGGDAKAVLYIRALLPIAVFLFALLCAIPVLAKSANPNTLFVILILMFGLPTALASVGMTMASKRKKITVTASPLELIIERPQGGRVQTTIIPAQDVLDLDTSTVDIAIASARQSVDHDASPSPKAERVLAALSKLIPNPGIMVKSRGGLITFGQGLSADELRYLVWLLRKALTA